MLLLGIYRYTYFSHCLLENVHFAQTEGQKRGFFNSECKAFSWSGVCDVPQCGDEWRGGVRVAEGDVRLGC